jgi:hypothetical protein
MFDLFSQPFQFRFGSKDEVKKTSVGFLTSLLVVGLSFAYLIYLIVL